MSTIASGLKERRPNLSFRKKLLFSLVAVVGGLILIEVAARIWLAAKRPDPDQADAVGIQTNWFEILSNDLNVTDAATNLYVPHPELFWALQPNADLKVENEVYQMREAPVTWTIQINEDGHRGRPSPPPPADSFPIVVCLGDSCTFGFRADQGTTYPAQLEKFLRGRGQPKATVVNYGIPGYTTFQGRLMLEDILQRHRPDVVILAYGANDLEPDRRSDSEKARNLSAAPRRLAPFLNRLALIELLGRFKRSNPQRGGTGAEGVVRVSLEEYRNNLQTMVQMAQSVGARVILLDMILSGQIDRNGMAYRTTISTLAVELELDWLDCLATLRAVLADPQRFKSERTDMDDFWDNEVVDYRLTYYDKSAYDGLFKDPIWRDLIRYFLVEPVHPNALGHRVIAEEVGKRILAEVRKRRATGEGKKGSGSNEK